MIDIESDVLLRVREAVLKKFPNTYVTDEYIRKPKRFPCLMLSEINNSVLVQTQSSSSNENHARISFQLDVYSNRVNDKKRECREIAAIADNVLLQIGFTRSMLDAIPNLEDATIYRLTGRYTAVASKDKKIYRG